jgi:hypothetical protein
MFIIIIINWPVGWWVSMQINYIIRTSLLIKINLCGDNVRLSVNDMVSQIKEFTGFARNAYISSLQAVELAWVSRKSFQQQSHFA